MEPLRSCKLIYVILCKQDIFLYPQNNYLHQMCPFVGWFANRITQKLLSGIP